MFGQMTRRAVIFLLALVTVAGGVSAPAWAGEDKGMCSADHSRGQIPRDFPLSACFDGRTLYMLNGTQFPLLLTVTGDGAGQPERYTKGTVGGASSLMSYIRPGDFGLVPPSYYIKVRIGNGQAKVHIGTASSGLQKMYVISETIWRFVPVGDAFKAVADLVNELSQVGDEYIRCRARNNAWGDVGCSALLGRNVAFAVGRAAINGWGPGLVKAVIALFDTAKWANAAVGDLIKLKDGTSDFTIAAVAPAKPTAQASQPPTGNQGNGNAGGGNNPPPATNAPAQPQTATATVQNMHLVGSSGLAEDTTPSYLSTVMQPRCANSGCKIGGTDMWSGDAFTAICWTTGAMMTNENRNTAADDGNPNRIDTDRWLRGVRSGQTGYISYIYVTPGSRNLNIPHC